MVTKKNKKETLQAQMAILANGTKNLKRNTKSIYIFPEYRK